MLWGGGADFIEAKLAEAKEDDLLLRLAAGSDGCQELIPQRSRKGTKTVSVLALGGDAEPV